MTGTIVRSDWFVFEKTSLGSLCSLAPLSWAPSDGDSRAPSCQKNYLRGILPERIKKWRYINLNTSICIPVPCATWLVSKFVLKNIKSFYKNKFWNQSPIEGPFSIITKSSPINLKKWPQHNPEKPLPIIKNFVFFAFLYCFDVNS